MKEKYVKCLIVIVVVSLMGIFIYQNINKENKPLPEVKLKEIVNNNKSFAIMIQEKSETDKYQEYSSNNWPGDDYKFKEAKCIDNNGDEIKDAVTYEEGKITLTTNKAVYCTVYFDKSIIGKLREDDSNKVLSTEEVGGMYRYQGLDKKYENDVVNNPDNFPVVDNNYICFGTTNKEECTTNEEKYMYRIIGITKDGSLKLVKKMAIREGDVLSFQWHNKVSISSPYTGEGDCDFEKCDWPNSLLFKRLNGISNGINKGSSGDTNLFLGTIAHPSSYNYLTEGNNWSNLIISHNWMYGDTLEGGTYDGKVSYEIENGIKATKRLWPKLGETQENYSQESYFWNKETDKIEAKIGMQYIYDYYYAYPNGKPINKENAKKSWIHFSNNDSEQIVDWFITRFTIYDNVSNRAMAHCTIDNGNVQSGSLYVQTVSVRPTFYLTNTIDLSGNGTKENPFIIDIE